MKRVIYVGVMMVITALPLTQVNAQAVFDAECSADFDGQYFSEKPVASDELCESGIASGTVEGDGSQATPWKWHCFDEAGNQGNRCEAFRSFCGNDVIELDEECDGEAFCSSECTVVASCNSTFDGAVLESEPSGALCATGSKSDVAGEGSEISPWTWNCNNSAGVAQAQCSATKAAEETTVDEEVEEVVVVAEVAEEVAEESPENPTSSNEGLPLGSATPQAACATGDYSDIKGHIWHDDNRNGVIDAGEEGIEDVAVELLNEDGDELEEDDTNSDGKFHFDNYAPGKYTIDVKSTDEDLDGYHIVYENDANRNERDQIKLKCDNNHTKTLFGYDTGQKEPAGDPNRPDTLSQTGGNVLLWLVQRIF